MMLGSEFVDAYKGTSLYAWEAAAIVLAEQGELTPWPWLDLPLADDQGNTAVLKVQSDVVAIGSFEDHVRLPLTPSAGQSVLNLTGSLLPTPWIAYQIWRAATWKLDPIQMVNDRITLERFFEHSQSIDSALAALNASVGDGVSGIKKHVVVSNLYQPKKVLIFGWYHPAPDVFDDGRPMSTPGRQPIQPRSNVHGDFYVDYSHGIQAVGPEALVNGRAMPTEELYRHPTLSKLVSNEGPIKVPRYPAKIPRKTWGSAPTPAPLGSRPYGPLATGSAAAGPGMTFAPTTPGATELGFAFTRRHHRWV